MGKSKLFIAIFIAILFVSCSKKQEQETPAEISVSLTGNGITEGLTEKDNVDKSYRNIKVDYDSILNDLDSLRKEMPMYGYMMVHFSEYNDKKHTSSNLITFGQALSEKATIVEKAYADNLLTEEQSHKYESILSINDINEASAISSETMNRNIEHAKELLLRYRKILNELSNAVKSEDYNTINSLALDINQLLSEFAFVTKLANYPNDLSLKNWGDLIYVVGSFMNETLVMQETLENV